MNNWQQYEFVLWQDDMPPTPEFITQILERL